MLDHNEFYLPTHALYQLPEGSDYAASKTHYLIEFYAPYTPVTDKDKWTFLIDKTVDSIKVNAELVLVEHNIFDILVKFKKNLIEKSEIFGMKIDDSLSRCIGYFEDLIFMLNTSDPRFSLTSADKKTLLDEMLDIIAEYPVKVNRNEKLRAILATYRKDTDWVKGKLSLERSFSIQSLAKKYAKSTSAFFKDRLIDANYRFNQLAHQQGFGIEKADDTRSPSLVDLFVPKDMDVFFHNNHAWIVQNYEERVIENLVNFIVNEWHLRFPQARFNNDANEKTEPSEEVTAISEHASVDFSDNESSINSVFSSRQFKQFLASYFPAAMAAENDIPSSDFLPSIKDDSNFEWAQTQVYKSILKPWVIKKLQLEGYYISLQDLLSNSDLASKIRLRPGAVTIQDILTVATDLQNDEIQNTNKALYYKVFKAYPEFALYAIQVSEHLDWANHIPTSPYVFVDQVFAILNKRLETALIQDTDVADKIAHKMLQTLPIDEYFAKLSTAANKCLIKNNDWIMSIHQNILKLKPSAWSGKFKTDYATLTATIKAQLPSSEFPNDHEAQIHCLISIQICKFLSETDSVSVKNFLQSIPYVPPKLLAAIITTRNSLGYPPLPFCEDSSILVYLVNFSNYMHRTSASWNTNARSIKQLAYKQLQNTGYINNEDTLFEEDPRNWFDNVNTLLAYSGNWFEGFMRYRARLRGDAHANQLIYTKLKQILDDILRVPLNMSLAYIAGVLAVIQAGVAILMLMYLSPFILGAALLTGFFVYPKNKMAAGIILGCLAAPFLLPPFLVVLSIVALIMAIYSCYKIFSDLLTTLAVSLIALSTAHGLFFNTTRLVHHLPFQHRCERIIQRLDFFEAPSAQQKKAILHELYVLMIADFHENYSESELVNKSYAIRFNAQDYSVSFAQVAAIPRLTRSEFSLTSPPSTRFFGIFKNKPTSATLLDGIENNLSFIR